MALYLDCNFGGHPGQRAGITPVPVGYGSALQIGDYAVSSDYTTWSQ